MKILLVCEQGMSTSILLTKMEKEASNRDIDITIGALPLSEAEKVLDEWDVILLGPQIKQAKMKLKLKGCKVPIGVINDKTYGLMEGERVLDQALELAKK